MQILKTNEEVLFRYHFLIKKEGHTNPEQEVALLFRFYKRRKTASILNGKVYKLSVSFRLRTSGLILLSPPPF